jgi:anti-sigma factor RsiW
MNHQTALGWLPAYMDGEAGFVRRLRLRRHIAGCPSCLAEQEALLAMRAALRTSLAAHPAPPALASRIGSALQRELAPPRPNRRAAFRLAGPALAGACAGVALTLLVTGSPGRDGADPLLSDAVAGHVRSMMADHLTDVPTSDQHTVKPWLSSRLTLSPVVKDLAPEGFPLIGGRLDYISGQPSAAVVYRRDRHVINLFALRAADTVDSPPRVSSRDGFNTVRWRMGGVTYIAVSDVEAAQLMAFVRLVMGA